MSIAVRVLFAIFAGFATASAQAQLLPAWETNIVLTQQDLDMIHGVVTNQVHGKPVETCRFLVHPGLRKLGLGQAGQKTRSEKSRFEEVEYTVRSGGSPHLFRALSFDQLSQAGRDLETCLDRLAQKTADVAGI